MRRFCVSLGQNRIVAQQHHPCHSQRRLAIHVNQCHLIFFFPRHACNNALVGAILPSFLCSSGPEHARSDVINTLDSQKEIIYLKTGPDKAHFRAEVSHKYQAVGYLSGQKWAITAWPALSDEPGKRRQLIREFSEAPRAPRPFR